MAPQKNSVTAADNTLHITAARQIAGWRCSFV